MMVAALITQPELTQTYVFSIARRMMLLDEALFVQALQTHTGDDWFTWLVEQTVPHRDQCERLWNILRIYYAHQWGLCCSEQGQVFQEGITALENNIRQQCSCLMQKLSLKVKAAHKMRQQAATASSHSGSQPYAGKLQRINRRRQCLAERIPRLLAQYQKKVRQAIPLTLVYFDPYCYDHVDVELDREDPTVREDMAIGLTRWQALARPPQIPSEACLVLTVKMLRDRGLLTGSGRRQTMFVWHRHGHLEEPPLATVCVSRAPQAGQLQWRLHYAVRREQGIQMVQTPLELTRSGTNRTWRMPCMHCGREMEKLYALPGETRFICWPCVRETLREDDQHQQATADEQEL